MFRKKQPNGSAPIPADRIRLIAGKAPPADYTSVEAGSNRASRQPVFRQGLAILPSGEKVPVAIKSISATGLKIEYFQNRTLPRYLVVSELSLGLHVKVELVWQEEGVAGLRILRDDKPAS